MVLPNSLPGLQLVGCKAQAETQCHSKEPKSTLRLKVGSRRLVDANIRAKSLPDHTAMIASMPKSSQKVRYSYSPRPLRAILQLCVSNRFKEENLLGVDVAPVTQPSWSFRQWSNGRIPLPPSGDSLALVKVRRSDLHSDTINVYDYFLVKSRTYEPMSELKIK